MALSDWVRKAIAEATEWVHHVYDGRQEYDKERAQYEAAVRQAFAEAGERMQGGVSGGRSNGEVPSKATVAPKPNRQGP